MKKKKVIQQNIILVNKVNKQGKYKNKNKNKNKKYNKWKILNK